LDPIGPVPQLVELKPVELKPQIAPPTVKKYDQYDATTRTWTVAKGDTLWHIGRKHGVSPKAIAAANNMSTASLLRVGQKLRIPQPGEIVATKATPDSRLVKPRAADTKPIPKNVAEHIVAKGDSLWRIARQYGIRVADLRAWNKLNSDMLRPGQILTVKGDKITKKEVLAKVSHAPKEAIPAIIKGAPSRAKRIDVTAPTVTAKEKAAGSTRLLPHYVAAGDSVRSIALLYDVKEADIRASNPELPANGALTPGIRLEIPLSTGRY
jgi:LysM repeat protein